MKAPKQVALTEGELLRRLRVRYTERSGNGDAYAFIPKVRSAAAFDARRTIDAYAMSLWPSRGLGLTAFEIKSSRSDWLRELKNPAKAEEFCELADWFYLVVGDKAIVRPGELPETWGLMVPHGTGLRVEVEAPRLRDAAPPEGSRARPLPPGFSRSFTAALLRAACFVGKAQPEEITAAVEAERERMAVEHERRLNIEVEERERLAKVVREFHEASGISLGNRWHAEHDPREVGKAVRIVLNGEAEAERFESRLRTLGETAERLARDIAKRVNGVSS